MLQSICLIFDIKYHDLSISDLTLCLVNSKEPDSAFSVGD